LRTHIEALAIPGRKKGEKKEKKRSRVAATFQVT
jgi:hypothetical protein